MALDKDLSGLFDKYLRQYAIPSDRIYEKLEMLALHIFAQLPQIDQYVLDGRDSEDSEVDLRNNWVGGAGDRMIDAILYDESRSSVVLIQAKHQGKLDGPKLLEEAKAFFSNLENWGEGRRSIANKPVAEALDDADFDPFSQEVRLVFVASPKIGNFSDLPNAARDHTEIFRERGMNVSCEVYGATELCRFERELVNSRSGTMIPDANIVVPSNAHFIFEESGHRVLVAAVKARSISDMYQETGNGIQLFETNVRAALATSPINNGMEKTLRDVNESANFFLYNNGITMTCTAFDVAEGNQREVVMTNPQVVNGAQTVKSIHNALNKKEGPHPAWVLVRIIETGEEYRAKRRLAEQIARYQNTQNAIKDWDFHSNDNIQKWMAEHGASAINKITGFRDQGLNLFYLHKRGSGSKPKGSIQYQLDTLGLLRYAFLNGPIDIFTKPKAFWATNPDDGDDKSLYLMAFGREGEKIDSYDGEDLAQIAWAIAVNERLKSQVKDYKKQLAALSDNSPARAVLELKSKNQRALSRWVMALAANGLRVAFDLKRYETISSFGEIMGTKSNFDHVYDDVVVKALEVVMELLNKRQGESRPNVNLSKSDNDWKEATLNLSLRLG